MHVKTYLAIGLSLSLTAISHADNGDPKNLQLVSSSATGFYYDAKTNRYFSDGKASFSIRPVEDPKYLERIEVSLDDGEYQQYSGKMKFDKEGFHLIRFRAVDPVLNWSPLQEFRVFVDLTPPKSFAFWQGPSFQNDKTLFIGPSSSLSIAAQDTVSGVAKVVWDDGSKQAVFSGQAHFKSEGEHTVRFASVDNVGNQEPWQELHFQLDAKPPMTQAEVKGNGLKTEAGLYVNAGSQIVLTAHDDASGVKVTEYQIGNGPVTEYHDPILVTEKRVELKFHSVDQVGNKEAWKSLVVLQDTNPPVIGLEKVGNHILSGGKIFATPGFAFNIKAKDDETGLQDILITRDGGKTYEKAASNKIDFTQPGTYQFSVKASDKVGNTAEANPYTVIIDNQAPKSVVRGNNNLVQKDGVFVSSIPNTIDIVATDDGVGVDHVEISYDGKQFTPLTKPIDLAQWSQQKRTIYFRSVDRLGNREAAQSMPVVIRTEGPKVDLFVESEKLPEVPLSALRNGRVPGRQEAPRAPAGDSAEDAPQEAGQ